HTDVPLDGLSRRTGRRAVEEGPDGRALQEETHALLERAVASLPQDYRDAYLLADVEGLPNQEAADLLGIGRAARKGRLHRARLLLRDALSPHFRSGDG